MKIRTQFIGSTIILGSFLLLVFASEIITIQWAQKINLQEELAAQVERQAYELGYLANDYLLHHESQQASRWESKFASFSNNLSNLEGDTPEQQALLANIKASQQRQKAVFAEIKASIENMTPTQDALSATKFMQVSWSRLEVQNQGMIFDVSRLARRLREQEDQLRLVTSLLNFVLISILGAFLLGNYALVFRRILQSLTKLQAGTKIIGSGELDFVIDIKNEDEIGELSRAFNQMTANLKQVTASKADLEKEIIERELAEEALRASEAKYRNLFENMTEEVHFWQLVRDEAGNIQTWRLVDANPPTLKTWGRASIDEIRGKTTDEIFGPGAAEHFMPVVQKIMTEGAPYAYEDYFPNLDKYFRFTSVPLGDYFITTGADITSIRKVQEALQRSEALLQAVLDNVPDAIFLKDRDSRLLLANPATLAIIGKPAKAVLGKTDAEFYDDPATGLAIMENDRRIMESGKMEVIEESVPDPAGMRVYLSTKAPYRDADGRVIGLIGIAHNITERKRAEEELRETNEELDQFNHAMVGRELRMIELKQEVNALCENAGQPPRYPLNLEKEK